MHAGSCASRPESDGKFIYSQLVEKRLQKIDQVMKLVHICTLELDYVRTYSLAKGEAASDPRACKCAR